jgi:cytoskeletal protein CcmA (bactofilin family)
MIWRSHNGSGPMADKIENVVGRSCTVRGDLAADGAFRVDGTIEGSVASKAAVVIGESGAVTGNVRGVDVVVAGKIHGNVCCSGHLEIMATGAIEGDIDAKSLRVETGGAFAGTSRMGVKGADAPAESNLPPLPPPLSAVR